MILSSSGLCVLCNLSGKSNFKRFLRGPLVPCWYTMKIIKGPKNALQGRFWALNEAIGLSGFLKGLPQELFLGGPQQLSPNGINQSKKKIQYRSSMTGKTDAFINNKLTIIRD